MTPERFMEEVELERLWREEEVRSMNNILINLNEENDKNRLRRAIVCLLYAHVEGFVKFIFNLYIDAINKLDLKCQQVKPILVAAVYHEDFKKLTSPDAKSKLFTKQAQNDSHIRRLSLQAEFFERINEYFQSKIKISEGYINTESNVGREVLEKLLYQVGLSHKELESTIKPLSKLKNKRNGISHGVDKMPVDEESYNEFFKCTLSIIDDLSKTLYRAYSEQEFLIKENLKVSPDS